MPTGARERDTARSEFQLVSLLHRLDGFRRTLDARSALGAADRRLLWLLGDGEPRSLRTIASELHLEQSTVNRQVNAALNAGYLRRFRSAAGSSYQFGPTPLGRQTFDLEMSVALESYGRALDGLGEQGAGQLLELLGEFVDRYGEAVDRPHGASRRETP